MAFVGGIAGGATAAAIAALKRWVPCYICGKEIQVLETGEDENTCVSCGRDFCSNHGISFICVRCFNRTPNQFQTQILEDRDRLYEKNRGVWIYIVATIIEILIGIMPVLFGYLIHDIILIFITFMIILPIVTMSIPFIIQKFRSEKLRNLTITYISFLREGIEKKENS